MDMVEVQAFELEGEALEWAWKKATGKQSTNTVHLLAGMARFVISVEIGDVVSVPAKLMPKAGK